MIYTVNEIRQKLYARALDVYEIFKNYFGEEFVDLHGMPADEELISSFSRFEVNGSGTYEISDTVIEAWSVPNVFILVWWPSVTVSNESDRSVHISDLYAKVTIASNGRIPYEYIGFELVRTTFTSNQYISGYIHSHVPRLRDGHPLTFQSPCLGQGPIRRTIGSLKNDFDETTWMLFCTELSMYVTVESLSGGPYIRMEEIGRSRTLIGYAGYEHCRTTDWNQIERFYGMSPDMIRNFIEYYLMHGHLNIGFKDDVFVECMDFYDYIIDISNTFIEWFNATRTSRDLQNILEHKGIISGRVIQRKFYEDRIDNRNTLNNSNSSNPILTFKGEEKYLSIINLPNEQMESVTLLSSDIAMFILQNITKVINYRFENNERRKEGSASTASEKVIYI